MMGGSPLKTSRSTGINENLAFLNLWDPRNVDWILKRLQNVDTVNPAHCFTANWVDKRSSKNKSPYASLLKPVFTSPMQNNHQNNAYAERHSKAARTKTTLASSS
jgi:hypothetical protein